MINQAVLAKLEKQAIGYFGLVIPRQNIYQGFWILPGYDLPADSLIKKIAELSTTYMKPSIRLDEPNKESNEIDTKTAAMSAALVEFWLTANSDGIQAAATGTMRLLERKYFAILAHLETGGTRTEARILSYAIEDVLPGLSFPVPVTSVALARSALHAMPEVRAINARHANGKTCQ